VEVIGAGFGRTGTLSLKSALETLGYGPCYHMSVMMRNPSHAGFWAGAAERAGRGEVVDWEILLAGYGASVDWPGCVFYEELARAYPGAKVLLSVRDPDSWYESFRATIGRGWEDPARRSTRTLKLFRALVPGADRQVSAIEAVLLRRTFGKASLEEPVDRRDAISAFVAHNAEVKRRVPEERLLVWEVKDGWGPLCAFLGVSEPEEPFPWVNEREGFESTVLANLAVGILRASAPAALAGAAGVTVGALVLWSLRRPPRAP
jgi:hypothetical protein